MCIEKYAISSGDNEYRIICNKIQFAFERPFTATEVASGEDQDLTFRKYQVTAGWDVAASGAAPGKQDFPTQVVDYEEGFIGAAYIYTGAIKSVAMYGAVLASASLLAF